MVRQLDRPHVGLAHAVRHLAHAAQPAGLLLGWIALNLVGGRILSVLPLPILPFMPSQTLYHYAFHGVYTFTQVPAVVLLVREIARRRVMAAASLADGPTGQ